MKSTALVVTAAAIFVSAVAQSPNDYEAPIYDDEQWSTGYVKKRAVLPAENVNASYSVDAIAACNAAGQPCDLLKRTALAIDELLKLHSDAAPSPCTPGSFCDMRRRELGDIASSAIDGYDYVVRREDKALGKRSDENEGPSELIKYCDDSTTFCARKRTADPEVHGHVKRCVKLCKDRCPQALKQLCHQLAGSSTLHKHPPPHKPTHRPTHKPSPKPTHKPTHKPIPHPKPDPGNPSRPHLTPGAKPKSVLPPNVDGPGKPYDTNNPKQKWFGPKMKLHSKANTACMLRPGGPCFRKRTIDINADNVDEESMQPGGVVDILAAIKYTVEHIKAEAAEQQQGAGLDHEAAWSPYGPSKNAMPYFHDIDHAVNAAADTFEA